MKDLKTNVTNIMEFGYLTRVHFIEPIFPKTYVGMCWTAKYFRSVQFDKHLSYVGSSLSREATLYSPF